MENTIRLNVAKRIRFVFLILAILIASTASGQEKSWKAGVEVSASEAKEMIGTEAFVATVIPKDVKSRMLGKSLPKNATKISISDLRFLKLLHYTLDGKIKTGEMVVNKAIAHDVIDIFRELYNNKYPIERMQLIDDFNANDEESMRANNTSGFCYREIKGSKRLSKHSQGRAVDINPLYNPCFRIVFNTKGDSIGYKRLQPETAAPYTNRSKTFPYKLTANDLAVKLFKKKGFTWGGNWKRSKDYQHFEK